MIRNVVLSARCSKSIDVRAFYPLAQKMKSFNAYKVRIRGATFLIFATGRIILTGLNKLKEARKIVKDFCLKHAIKLICCKVVNITGSNSIRFKINFNMLLETQKAEYEPELFPGIYFTYGKAKIILFHTGKYILTGFKTKKQLVNANTNFINKLKAFKTF